MRLSPCPCLETNDLGCQGVLIEEVGFAVDPMPEKTGFEFAFPRALSSISTTLRRCVDGSESRVA
jgi:hypothetical protein